MRGLSNGRSGPRIGPRRSDRLTALSDSPVGLVKPLTSARFFAAAAVVLFHSGASWASANPSVPAPIQRLLLNGYLGVTFFFVLSGFVLHLTYRGRAGLGKFWVARIARIYPVYLLAVLAMLPFVTVSGWRDVPQFLGLHTWVTGMSDWNMPTWTLSVEMFFYLCFPWLSRVVAAARDRSLVALIVAIVVFDFVTNASALSDTRSGFYVWMTHTPLPLLRLPEFVLGIAAAELHQRGHRLPFPAWLPLIVLVAGVCSIAAAGVATLATAMSAAIIVTLAAEPDTRLARALSSRSLVLLGGASYALYLLHAPVHDAVVMAFGTSKAAVALQYPLMLALSVVVFRFYEEPAREWLRRLFGRKPSVMAASLSNGL